MTKLEQYQAILSYPDMESVVFPMLFEFGHSDQFEFKQLNKSDFKGFPFILAIETYDKELGFDYAARYLSFSLDLSPVCPEAKDFHFPLVAIPDLNTAGLTSFLETGNYPLIAHEVTHIKDLLSYTEKNPGYYDDLANYSINTVQSIADLKSSLEFEIGKLMLLEPNALQAEYESGNHSIPVPVLWMMKHIDCQSVDEFIHIQLCGSLFNLFEQYKTKFSQDENMVTAAFIEVISRQNNTFLGSDAFDSILNIYRYLYRKLGIPI